MKRPREVKGIGNVAELRGLGIEHLHDVKAKSEVGHIELAQPREGGTDEEAALAGMDGGGRASVILTAARLHFNKN